MENLDKPCVYCGDPIYKFQEAYHEGCAVIKFQEKIITLKEQIKKLKAK